MCSDSLVLYRRESLFGTVEWNGGMDYWNGIAECHAYEMLLGQHVVSLDRSHQLLEDDQHYQVRV